jgi:putative NADH-flavin reductase
MTTTASRRVTVFGASGNIGRHVVEQLLTHGHAVTAFVRNPTKLGIAHPNLTVVTGELHDKTAIATAVAGAEAVISALGPSLRRRATGMPITEGTRNIVDAATAAGAPRYIGLATPSVADERDRPTLKAKVLPLLARLMFPNALKELVAMTEAVRSSDLDWTIARITNPTDRPAKRTFRSGFLGRDKVGSSMTRADVAAFLVEQLDDDRYRRAAPAISN